MPVPTESIRKLVNVAVPLPAAVPMSRVLVPWSGPVPLLRLTVTFRLLGKPNVELLPNESCALTTGWVPRAEPAVPLPGCVEKTRRLTVPTPTAMALEVEGVAPEVVNWMVMFVAML